MTDEQMLMEDIPASLKLRDLLEEMAPYHGGAKGGLGRIRRHAPSVPDHDRISPS